MTAFIFDFAAFSSQRFACGGNAVAYTVSAAAGTDGRRIADAAADGPAAAVLVHAAVKSAALTCHWNAGLGIDVLTASAVQHTAAAVKNLSAGGTDRLTRLRNTAAFRRGWNKIAEFQLRFTAGRQRK